MLDQRKLPSPKAILWDMDGTLIDQTEAIILCYVNVITAMGYTKPETARIRRSLGGPMASTMSLFVEESRLDEACAAFRMRFPEIMFDGLVILPGGEKLIERAFKARIPQAILTNKHGETARKISRYVGFSKYLPTCIGSGDTSWQKPNTELTLHALEKIQANIAGAIIIGDSPTDIDVAKNSGAECYCVSTGAHTVEELLAAGASAAFADLLELGDALQITV